MAVIQLSVPSKRVETLPLEMVHDLMVMFKPFSTLKAGRDLAAFTEDIGYRIAVCS